MTIDIANLRKLLDAATPGPWHREWADSHPDPANIEILSIGRGDRIALIEEPDDASEVADADLIVALRNAAPAIIDEVERLRGIVPELPPRPPEGEGMPRYGIRWHGLDRPLAAKMDDGYWTPWHLANAEVERLRAALELVAGNLAAAQQKRADAPMSAETHIDEAIQAVQFYAPADGQYSEAARKLRTDLWSFASETRMERKRGLWRDAIDGEEPKETP